MRGAARTWTFFSDSKMFLDSEFEISVMGESDLCAHRHGAGRKRCNLAACKLRRIAPSGGSDRRRSMSWRCCTRRTRRSSSATDCRGDTGHGDDKYRMGRVWSWVGAIRTSRRAYVPRVPARACADRGSADPSRALLGPARRERATAQVHRRCTDDVQSATPKVYQ